MVVLLPLLQLLPLLAVGWLVGLAFRDLRRARKHRRPPPYNLLPGILKDEAPPADAADRVGHDRWYLRLGFRRRGQHRHPDACAGQMAISDGGGSSGDPPGGATSIPAVVLARGLPHRLSSITGNSTPSQRSGGAVERRSRWSGGSDEGRGRATPSALFSRWSGSSGDEGSESRKSRWGGGAPAASTRQGSTGGGARDSTRRGSTGGGGCDASSIVVDEAPERPSRSHDRHKHLCSLASSSQLIAESSQPAAIPAGMAAALAESSATAMAVTTASRMRSVNRGMSCRDLGLTAEPSLARGEGLTASVVKEEPPPPQAAPFLKKASLWGGMQQRGSTGGAPALETPATLALETPGLRKSATLASFSPPPRDMPPGWVSARTKIAAVSAFQGGLRAKVAAPAAPAPAAAEAGGPVPKVVELMRTPLGLGLSLDSQNRVVAIAPGSQAERCGGFAVHDRLLSLNGRSLRGGAFKEQLGAIAVGTKVRIEIASLRGPTAGSGSAPAGGPGAHPDAEIVRRALAEHGARVKAEALAEAKAEASEIKAEAANVLADATAQAQRTESAAQQAREAAQLALGAVASIAASAQRYSSSSSSPAPIGRAAVRRANSADRRVRPMPDTPYAMTVGLALGSVPVAVRRPSAPSHDAAEACSDGEDAYDTGVYTV